MSYSQAAFKNLNGFSFESKVLGYFNALNSSASRNSATLMWVPGHGGVEGSEMTDGLTKEGSERRFVSPALLWDKLELY